MSMNRFALPTLALFLIGGFSAAGTSAAPLSSPVFSGGQERGWDEPPREFNEIQRRGFHDGIEGARRDMDNHRNPDVDNRDEYRNANFPPEIREQYREAYRRGYMMAINRMNGGGPPPMAQPVQPPPPMLSFGWEGVPNRFSEIHRRGLQDGVEGARRDLENHRRPDPDNRDEYRNPNVPLSFGRITAKASGAAMNRPFRSYMASRKATVGTWSPDSSPRYSAGASGMAWKEHARTRTTTAAPIRTTATSIAVPTFRSSCAMSTARASVGGTNEPWPT